jgi:hypothetical protein
MSQSDIDAIAAIIRGMFDAVGWDRARGADWAAFGAPVRPDAVILPSARPAQATTLAAFAERMGGLRERGVIETFAETIIGVDVQVFGNVAVARAAYATAVNGQADGRGLNVFLLVKDAGAWSIAALAWDNESATTPLPEELVRAG